jgi:hypothetical protein
METPMAACQACGAMPQAGDLFCPQCGSRLSVQPAPPADAAAVTQGAMNLSDVRFKLGMVYFKKGEFARAIEAWEKVPPDSPNHGAVQKLIQEARSRT